MSNKMASSDDIQYFRKTLFNHHRMQFLFIFSYNNIFCELLIWFEKKKYRIEGSCNQAIKASTIEISKHFLKKLLTLSAFCRFVILEWLNPLNWSEQLWERSEPKCQVEPRIKELEIKREFTINFQSTFFTIVHKLTSKIDLVDWRSVMWRTNFTSKTSIETQVRYLKNINDKKSRKILFNNIICFEKTRHHVDVTYINPGAASQIE